MGKSTINGHFSIAMLNYQRVSSEVLRMLLISEGKFSRYPNLRSTDRERERTNDQHLAQK